MFQHNPTKFGVLVDIDIVNNLYIFYLDLLKQTSPIGHICYVSYIPLRKLGEWGNQNDNRIKPI